MQQARLANIQSPDVHCTRLLSWQLVGLPSDSLGFEHGGRKDRTHPLAIVSRGDEEYEDGGGCGGMSSSRKSNAPGLCLTRTGSRCTGCRCETSDSRDMKQANDVRCFKGLNVRTSQITLLGKSLPY